MQTDSQSRAVLTLLNDPEWTAWSDREIARHCGVHRDVVVHARPKSSLVVTTSERTYTTKHGTTAKMKTRRDSPKSQREWLSTRYTATLRDLECIDAALLKLSSKCAAWYTLMRQVDAAYKELDRIRKFHDAAEGDGTIYEFLEPRSLQCGAEFPQPKYPDYRAFESAHIARFEVIAAPRKYAPTIFYLLEH